MNKKSFTYVFVVIFLQGICGINGLSAQTKRQGICTIDLKAKPGGVFINGTDCQLIFAKKANQRQAEVVIRTEAGEVVTPGAAATSTGTLLPPEKLLSYGELRRDQLKGNPCEQDGEKGKKILLPLPCGPEGKELPVLVHACGSEMPPFYVTALCYENWTMNGEKVSNFSDVRRYVYGTGTAIENMMQENVCIYQDRRGGGVSSLFEVADQPYAIAIIWRDMDAMKSYRILINEQLMLGQ